MLKKGRFVPFEGSIPETIPKFKNAPKEIVQNDKKLLKELTIEDSKLRSIVSSIN